MQACGHALLHATLVPASLPPPPAPCPRGEAAVRAVGEGELSWHLWGQRAPYLGRRQAEGVWSTFPGGEAHLRRTKTTAVTSGCAGMGSRLRPSCLSPQAGTSAWLCV